MAAQPGSSIVLEYGTQGSRQPGAGMVLEYSDVARPRVMLTSAIRNRWRAATVEQVSLTAVGPATAHLDEVKAAAWTVGAALQGDSRAPWAVGGRADRAKRAPWVVRERRIDPAQHAPWLRAAKRDDETRTPWGRYERRIDPTQDAPWVRAIPRDDGIRMPWGRPAAVDPSPVHNVFPRVVDRDLDQWVPWVRYSRPLQPGWGVVTPPGPVPNPEGTWVIQVKQVYIMINETSLTRVSDGAVIPTLGLSVSLDANSWDWGFTATVPFSADALVARGEELQAAINGDVVRLVVRSKSRSRTFGKDTLTVSGVGRAAELGAPFSPVLSFGNLSSQRTAQQLAYDALLDNGVPLDWSIDWQLEDWDVPAGAWAMRGPRIDALKAIAAAAGGYVQPHMTDKVLRVLHRYPTAPWGWAGVTPDFELPAAVVRQEGIEWSEKAVYNRVFVSGQGQGVLGQVTREGTAGDAVAEMVTDALITDTPAVRQRGRAILSDTGLQALVTLSMPVLEDSGGLILPGKFVKYVDGSTERTGIARSLQVSVGHPQVWQTIQVETHE